MSTAGAALVPRGVDISCGVCVGYQQPSTDWDGPSRLIGFGLPTSRIAAMNVARRSSSGVLLGGSPQQVAQGNWSMEQPACAARASGSQIIWADGHGGSSAFAAGASGCAPQSTLALPGASVEVPSCARDSGFAPPDNVSLTDALRFAM